ncbi:NCS1 nucleoside transporter [Colletotrichum graminicola]|uniref:NCS1 nucleoside transporter n=1 Tax=Colletotrichum graminicola (strain M1.001 / M2 / FGSC 10212) TaxID=645133 RepID=E3QPJ7_COLGM|nr:NCS1 nucleoside transporter [Colletotrichum graminicola M1.001]EFQ32902.1 NCS1 nucleoside transporter [Colletotrichum graminicola M1.001]WDK16563.1 NCS1 nucleoside transporter [Colletotrichum graminicola]
MADLLESQDGRQGHDDKQIREDVNAPQLPAASLHGKSFVQKVLMAGRVEEGGIQPIPLEARTNTKYFNAFTIWCSVNTNILAITFGMLGPVSFGLGLRDSALVILFFNLLSTLPPAYLATWGPKTGMRQMIQARFSFGYYFVYVPVVLNLATLTGFCVIICVIGGQCLSAVSEGDLSTAVGIVLIGISALLISFCGFNVLHFYEGYAWMPALVAIVIAVGCGGEQLKLQAPAEPATASGVLSFGGVIASYMIPWACIASDLTTYFDPTKRLVSHRIFAYSYLGLLVPTILLMTLGAAIGGAMSSIPAWQDGFNSTLVGGVLGAMLSPAGGFGKFILVVLAFTMLANISGTMYAITLNFQTLIPSFRLPRYIFSVIVTAIIIPISIRAAHDFFLNLENFIALIGYWSASFVGIVVVEHWVFRRANYNMYEAVIWEDSSKLPWGLAAIGAAALSFALVIPCISQVWFTGPIAVTTGDIGFEVAFVLSALLYLPLRYAERRLVGR